MITENINNLTALWHEASSPFTLYKSGNYTYSFIENSQWPNRLWFNGEITQECIKQIKKINTLDQLIIPHWDIYKTSPLDLLNQIGFDPLFTQTGMSLRLDNTIEKTNLNHIDLKTVSNESQMLQWSQLFKSSFNYSIRPEILSKTHLKINYYLAYNNEKPVGTAITNHTNEVMGIHAIGIPLQYRRNGYAEGIMKRLITNALKAGSERITLQASDMGKNIYTKLGFTEDFKITNYASKNHDLFKNRKPQI